MSSIWQLIEPSLQMTERYGDELIWKYSTERSTLAIVTDEDPVEGDIGVFIERGDQDDARAAMAEIVWKGRRGLVLRCCEEHRSDFVVDEDHHFVPRPSQLATQLSERISAFSKAGHGRSAIFVGPPGSGKTSALAWLAHAHSQRLLRIPMQEIEDAWRYFNASVEFLRPDVLAIDDIDRASNTDNMMTELEQIRRVVPLVLLSANTIGSLSDAFLRPGRVDELIEIRSQPDVAKMILGDIKVRGSPFDKLPVAYAVEFRERVEAIGIERATRELPILLARAKKAEQEIDPELFESVEKVPRLARRRR